MSVDTGVTFWVLQNLSLVVPHRGELPLLQQKTLMPPTNLPKSPKHPLSHLVVVMFSRATLIHRGWMAEYDVQRHAGD
jgi:hypothetical protein